MLRIDPDQLRRFQRFRPSGPVELQRDRHRPEYIRLLLAEGRRHHPDRPVRIGCRHRVEGFARSLDRQPFPGEAVQQHQRVEGGFRHRIVVGHVAQIPAIMAVQLQVGMVDHAVVIAAGHAAVGHDPVGFDQKRRSGLGVEVPAHHRRTVEFGHVNRQVFAAERSHAAARLLYAVRIKRQRTVITSVDMNAHIGHSLVQPRLARFRHAERQQAVHGAGGGADAQSDSVFQLRFGQGAQIGDEKPAEFLVGAAEEIRPGLVPALEHPLRNGLSAVTFDPVAHQSFQRFTPESVVLRNMLVVLRLELGRHGLDGRNQFDAEFAHQKIHAPVDAGEVEFDLSVRRNRLDRERAVEKLPGADVFHAPLFFQLPQCGAHMGQDNLAAIGEVHTVPDAVQPVRFFCRSD